MAAAGWEKKACEASWRAAWSQGAVGGAFGAPRCSVRALCDASLYVLVPVAPVHQDSTRPRIDFFIATTRLRPFRFAS